MADDAPTTQTEPHELFVFVSQIRAEAYLTYRYTRTFVSRFAGFLATKEGRQALDSGQVDPFPFVPNPNQYELLSPFAVTAMTDYRVEWDAEQCRRRHFPSHPSRLSAIYAFGNEHVCRDVSARYGWQLSSVRRFRIDDRHPHRAVRLNMEVVSLMRTAYPLASWNASSVDDVWRHYWGGGGNLPLEVPVLHQGQAWRTLESDVVWEWLIEGRLISDDDTPVFD